MNSATFPKDLFAIQITTSNYKQYKQVF